MKRRAHSITSREAGALRIVARVEGPEQPSIAALYRQFRETFGFPEPADCSMLDGPAFVDWLLAKNEALDRACETLGRCFAYDAASAFVAWLCDQPGWGIVTGDDFFVDR